MPGWISGSFLPGQKSIGYTYLSCLAQVSAGRWTMQVYVTMVTLPNVTSLSACSRGSASHLHAADCMASTNLPHIKGDSLSPVCLFLKEIFIKRLVDP